MNTYVLLFVSIIVAAGVGAFSAALVDLLRSRHLRTTFDGMRDELRTAFDDRAAFTPRRPAIEP